jgi:hypothetical protein
MSYEGDERRDLKLPGAYVRLWELVADRDTILDYLEHAQAGRFFGRAGQLYHVNALKKRVQVLMRDRAICVSCGVEGRVLAVELQRTHAYTKTGKRIPAVDSDGTFLHNGERVRRTHFNIYAIVGGREVMLTVDHITPKSLGGSSDAGNLVCMCQPCNVKKSNIVVAVEEKSEERVSDFITDLLGTQCNLGSQVHVIRGMRTVDGKLTALIEDVSDGSLTEVEITKLKMQQRDDFPRLREAPRRIGSES